MAAGARTWAVPQIRQSARLRSRYLQPLDARSAPVSLPIPGSSSRQPAASPDQIRRCAVSELRSIAKDRTYSAGVGRPGRTRTTCCSEGSCSSAISQLATAPHFRAGRHRLLLSLSADMASAVGRVRVRTGSAVHRSRATPVEAYRLAVDCSHSVTSDAGCRRCVADRLVIGSVVETRLAPCLRDDVRIDGVRGYGERVSDDGDLDSPECSRTGQSARMYRWPRNTARNSSFHGKACGAHSDCDRSSPSFEGRTPSRRNARALSSKGGGRAGGGGVRGEQNADPRHARSAVGSRSRRLTATSCSRRLHRGRCDHPTGPDAERAYWASAASTARSARTMPAPKMTCEPIDSAVDSMILRT